MSLSCDALWTIQATVSEEIDMSVSSLIDFSLYDSLARKNSHLFKCEGLIHQHKRQQTLMFTLLYQSVDFFLSNQILFSYAGNISTVNVWPAIKGNRKT